MKKMLMCCVLLLGLLTGCGMAGLDVEVELDTTYILDKVTVEYENGDIYEIESVFADKLDKEIASGICYKNDEKIGEEIYERDENGNVTTLTESWAGGVVKTYEYVYDAEKRITEKTEYANNVFQSRTEIVYGENGKEEKITKYDEDGNIVTYQEIVYDGNSQRTVKEYDADGKLLRYMKHKYSYADVVAKEEVFSAEDEWISTTVWHYVPHEDTVYYIDVDTEALDKLK